MKSMEDDLNGRQPQLKMNTMEDNLNRIITRRPQWKTTSMQDNQNGSPILDKITSAKQTFF